MYTDQAAEIFPTAIVSKSKIKQPLVLVESLRVEGGEARVDQI
jgi:hypothetical protein